jgi:hypothetical protein
MTTPVKSAGALGGLARPTPTGLADVIDTILDKGLVIDAYIRVSLVGIEVLTIDARIVVFSLDTYLRFAEAVNRLDIANQDDKKGLPGLLEDVGTGASKSKAKGAIEAAGEALREFLGTDEQRGAARPARRAYTATSTAGHRRRPRVPARRRAATAPGGRPDRIAHAERLGTGPAPAGNISPER